MVPEDIWVELARSGGTAAVIGLILYLTLRDHQRILRSIDQRLAKVLERVRDVVPHDGTGPIQRVEMLPLAPARQRQRSRHDSDEDTPVQRPRTLTEEDIER